MKKSFTLIELLVAMAVIAVLLGLGVFGINIVQQNARDTQRRKMLDNFKVALIASYSSGSSVPFNFGPYTFNSLYIGGSLLKLEGALARVDTAQSTTSSGTSYCYGANPLGQTFVVGVDLEIGDSIYVTNTTGIYDPAATGNSFGAAISGSGPSCNSASL